MLWNYLLTGKHINNWCCVVMFERTLSNAKAQILLLNHFPDENDILARNRFFNFSLSSFILSTVGTIPTNSQSVVILIEESNNKTKQVFTLPVIKRKNEQNSSPWLKLLQASWYAVAACACPRWICWCSCCCWWAASQESPSHGASPSLHGPGTLAQHST